MEKIYTNIRKKRLEHGYSQQKLAELVGYKGKSMIAKIEKGLVDLPSTMVTAFANALDCTESELFGWDDIEYDEQSHTWDYASDESSENMKYLRQIADLHIKPDRFVELLKECHDLPDEDYERIMAIIRALKK